MDPYQALLAQDAKLAPSREVARHLAKISLYELSGTQALHPQLQPLATHFISLAAASGFHLSITQTYRTKVLQDSIYAQGRTTPGAIITNAKGLESYHNYGLAFDVVFTTQPAYPDKSDPVWSKLGGIATSLGLVWGGTFGDVDHFEYHPLFSWQDLQPFFLP